MKRETVDIVEDIVTSLVNKVVVNSVVNNNDGTFTFFTDNTSYLAPHKNSGIEINGNEYKILNTEEYPFEFNCFFTVESQVDLSSITEINLNSLYYHHGTAMATKSYLDNEKVPTWNKYPLVYLLEVLRDRFNNNENLRLDRTSRLRLFFLSETDEDNWNTDQHYEYSIKPMRNVLYNFIDSLNNNAEIGKFDNYEAINHSKFGVYESDKGHTRRIFSDKLSGVELIIDLPILKGSLCCSNYTNK